MSMLTLKRVLCAIDFSDSSARAVGHAAAFARWYQADLTVVHVAAMLDRGFGPAPMESELVPVGPTHDQIVEDVRQTLAAAGVGALNPHVSVREGRPVTGILDEATAVHADLLVLGTHGRSGVSRLLLGSVSEKVVRTALCPVLTVPPHATSAPADAVLLKRILCPLDFSPSSKRALQYALSLAQEANGSLTVLHVIEWLPEEEPRTHAHFQVPDYRQHLLHDARERLHAEINDDVRAWCDVQEVVTFSKAYREILRIANTASADLIVMGAQGRDAVDSLLFGSTTEHVMRAASCPVLTLRAETPADTTA